MAADNAPAGGRQCPSQRPRLTDPIGSSKIPPPSSLRSLLVSTGTVEACLCEPYTPQKSTSLTPQWPCPCYLRPVPTLSMYSSFHATRAIADILRGSISRGLDTAANAIILRANLVGRLLGIDVVAVFLVIKWDHFTARKPFLIRSWNYIGSVSCHFKPR
jgi:hypothetical protein